MTEKYNYGFFDKEFIKKKFGLKKPPLSVQPVVSHDYRPGYLITQDTDNNSKGII